MLSLAGPYCESYILNRTPVARPHTRTTSTEMTPSSAPKLRVPSFTPEVGRDEALAIHEQREVNEGVRATFGSVHTTLRSQGAAIRGLEELMQRALPEVDRLSKLSKLTAEIEHVNGVLERVSALGESQLAVEARLAETARTCEGKFDGDLGQRALEALARQQNMAEHEVAAREAVANEVVRLASSLATFTTTLEAVRAESKRADPRLAALERRAEAIETSSSAAAAETDRRLGEKADSARIDAVTTEVTAAAEAAQRRFAKVEARMIAQKDDVMKALGAAMGREEAQRALDGLAEQIVRSVRELIVRIRRDHRAREPSSYV